MDSTNHQQPVNHLPDYADDQPTNLSVDQDEDAREHDPPNYENTPAYNPSTYHIPFLTYHLRATKSRTSHLVPFGPTNINVASYEISYRSSTALPIFNRKGDISISRLACSPNGPTSAAIVRADYLTSGPVPWHPRARFTLKENFDEGRDGGVVVEMGALDFKTWSFTHASTHYTWTLRSIPSSCLELSASVPSQSANAPVIARFTYGKVGTKVLAGGEVGQLDIFRDALTEEQEGVEVVVSGCVVIVKYFEGLGRRYRNDGSGGSGAASLINAKSREGTSVRGGLAYI